MHQLSTPHLAVGAMLVLLVSTGVFYIESINPTLPTSRFQHVGYSADNS